ncbi:MAG: hypothetical protein KGI19_09370 [Thaumarchaeota archaeon]|nr:hypothetical protein [Nitrososphaerota archaeon]
MKQNFRQTLKEILHDAYNNNNESTLSGYCTCRLWLVFHNNENVKNHVIDVQDRKKNENRIILDKIIEIQSRIDHIKIKDIVKAI